MAVFSNLEGTMKKTFILGKNGVTLSTDGQQLEVLNYDGDSLVPISAADPIRPSNLVTLSYFNSHSGGVLSGTTVPDPTLGQNGNVYYQVDATKIVQIYLKDNNIWKPFSKTTPTDDSDYVTTIPVTPDEFMSDNGVYKYSVLSNIHQRGTSLLVQVQDPGGNAIGTEVRVDGTGNIDIVINDKPSTNLNINIIGATTMTAPYSNNVDKSQWVLDAGEYRLDVPASTHGQQPGPLYLAIYENITDSPTSSEPFTAVTVDTKIDSAGNVVFVSYVPFSGKVVISGK